MPAPPRDSGFGWLAAAAAGCLGAMLLHLAIPFVGARADGWFGAAELVPLAEAGSPIPPRALAFSAVSLLFGLCFAAGLMGRRR